MSGSARSTWSTATTTPKYTTTCKALQQRLNAVETALTAEQPIHLKKESEAAIRSWETKLLAEGGYNYVWLVSYRATYRDLDIGEAVFSRKVVIREPKEEASPCQIENEIAFLTYIAKHHPSIPVPKVYTFNIDQKGSNSPFIAMEFIEGQPLDSQWSGLSEPEKTTIVDEIAQLVVQLGEIDLGGIGGLTLDHTLGPTVEGIKLFKGRDKFHSPVCYDIGPYASTHAYAVACYDKEIYYYTHASCEDLDEDLFDDTPKSKFVAELQATRDNLFLDPTLFSPEEPFALLHGDFCGRNIMVHNGHISAIIDWEFAGSYPLSELLGGTGVELFELEDENLLEYGQWSDRIRDMVVEKARGRGWGEEKIALLVGEGNRELQLARREMVPMGDFSDDDGHPGEGGPGAEDEVGAVSVGDLEV